MVDRTQPITRITTFAGWGAIALLLAVSLGSLLAVWLNTDISAGFTPADFRIIRFTLTQAFLSALISVILAIPLARALARYDFRGRQLFITFLGASFILPVIVAVFGILAIWGRSGLFSNILQHPLNIYGLTGVILAHVFFNLPLATRLILQGWLSVPTEHFRLCATLGMTAKDVTKHIERPILHATLPAAFLTIFLLCITSFAVALTLGGGPRATTVELAIYQALRFDFDLPKAALFATFQFMLCTTIALLVLSFSKPTRFSIGLDRPAKRWDGQSRFHKYTDISLLTLAGLFLFLPLAAILIKGIGHLPKLPASVIPASINSLMISLTSATICISLALIIASLIIRLTKNSPRTARAIEGISFLSLVASPFVIGTGLFIMIFPFVSPFKLALPITALVNAIMALPFAIRIILPTMQRAEASYGRLADSLGMSQFARFRLAIWPRLKPSAGFAMGLAAALSMGDLGVITLFASPDNATLPLTMYRLMASYQTDAASAVALLLITISLTLFWIFDKGGRIEHRIR
ncbi:MAG: thiamine/thiamine pyrophosphate ABC transporter permease ThiP [Amylibacter sp.]|nr:thiamine/thiamine pyrophosphate ABC transporter permease ThiP [Amylibacter sp.]